MLVHSHGVDCQDLLEALRQFPSELLV